MVLFALNFIIRAFRFQVRKFTIFVPQKKLAGATNGV